MDISKIWAGFGEFLKVYGPWITTALLPTLIVGLSKSPQTSGLAGWLKWLLQFLSIVTPRDAPGTFKLPLTVKTPSPTELPSPAEFKATQAKLNAPKASTPLGPDDKTVQMNKPPGALVVLIAGSLAFSTVSSGCSWLSNIGSGSKEGVINCGVESVMSGAANLIATVRAIVTGGAVNWQEQLDALKEMGEDALACALFVVGDQLLRESIPPTDAAGDSPAKQKNRALAAQGHNKAKMYVGDKKWQPTNTEELQRRAEAK